MSTATSGHTYRFADRHGVEYRATYRRDEWGRHTWDVAIESGGGMTFTDHRQEENQRELAPEEIITAARGWAGSTAANRDPGLMEPAGVADEDGRPLYHIHLALLAA